MEPGGTRLSQLRRGVIEHCVLALLSDEPLYGFDLVRRLSEVDGLVTSEGTIYPLLSRLRPDRGVPPRPPHPPPPTAPPPPSRPPPPAPAANAPPPATDRA